MQTLGLRYDALYGTPDGQEALARLYNATRWALTHNGLKPDFHDPFGFRVPLGGLE